MLSRSRSTSSIGKSQPECDWILKRSSSSSSIQTVGKKQLEKQLECDIVTELLTPESWSGDPVTDAPSTLLVVFAGLTQNFGGGEGKIPLEFVNTLHENKLADIAGGPLLVIFMRDRSKSWYFKGVQGVSDSLRGTVAFLKSEAEKIPLPRRVILLGSSMGGYGAILHGALLAKAGVPVDHIVAFSPQIYLDPLERLKRKINTPYETKIVEVVQFVKRGVLKEDRRYLDLTALAPLPCPVDVHVGDGSPSDIEMAVEFCKADATAVKNSGSVRVLKHIGGAHNMVTILRDHGKLPELLKVYLGPPHPGRDMVGAIVCRSDEAGCSSNLDARERDREMEKETERGRLRESVSLPALPLHISLPMSPKILKKQDSPKVGCDSSLVLGSKFKATGLLVLDTLDCDCHFNDEERKSKRHAELDFRLPPRMRLHSLWRPRLQPVCKGESGDCILRGESTELSRAIARQILLVAKGECSAHAGVADGSTALAPRLYAKNFPHLHEANKCMMQWTCDWILEKYGTPCSQLHFTKYEPHIISYRQGTDLVNVQKLHRDKTYVSVMMACSEPHEYVGGGTFFQSLNTTLHLKQGEVLVFLGRSPSCLHRGNRITEGERHLYLTFVHLREGDGPALYT